MKMSIHGIGICKIYASKRFRRNEVSIQGLLFSLGSGCLNLFFVVAPKVNGSFSFSSNAKCENTKACVRLMIILKHVLKGKGLEK